MRSGFTLHDLAALNEYWRTRPPVHVSVALYLGIKPAASSADLAAASEPSLAELADVIGAPPGRFRPPIPIQRPP